MQLNLATQCAFVAVRDESIQAFQQRAFATATGTGNQHQFASVQGKGNSFNRVLL